MPVVRLAGFGGENRATHPMMLPETTGTVSLNQKPGRGDLRPWKSPTTVATVPSGRQTIYRMGRDVASDSQYWLSWTGVVHAVRGFDAADTTERTYYSGDGAPKVTDNTSLDGTDPQSNPVVVRPLGVPAPASAPVVVSNVGGGVVTENLGQHQLLLSEAIIDTFVLGGILRVKVTGAADQLVTLTEPSVGAGVTLASLAAQLTALNGISASVVAATGTESAAVKILSDAVGVSFSIERDTGMTTPTSENPTYTALYEDSGAAATTSPIAAAAAATVTILHANIIAMAVGTVLSVKVNLEPDVLRTVSSGAGTYPASVTPDSLLMALSGIAGLTVALVTSANGVSKDLTITTTATGASAYVRLRSVTFGSTPVYATLANSTEIVAPAEASTGTYFYVYTYVNDWGWESAPSPVSAQNDRYLDATATISGFSAAPAGNYNITLIRIYRTQSSSSGATDFFFLREVAIGTTTTQDDLRDLGEVLPTTTWFTPPDNLSYLTSLWNGMLAGLSGNSVRFCESYTPYAWPVAYELLPPDSKPVALAAFGQSLVVLTTARPLIVSGSGPDSMDQQLLELPQGCVAARSVAAMGTGVAWASEDGLCWVGAGGARVLTEGLMLREDWQALVPSSIIGRMYEGRYFGSYDAGSGRKGFFIDPNNPTGLYFLSTGYTALHFDELRDQLYVLNGSNVQKWDAGTALTCTFRSKLFKQPKPVNFVTAKAQADSYPLTVRLYADGVLRHTQTVTSASPFRLPSGFEATTWQIEIEGTASVQYAMLATTVAELY